MNCIAVDDEPLALNLIESFINKVPFLKLKTNRRFCRGKLPEQWHVELRIILKKEKHTNRERNTDSSALDRG